MATNANKFRISSRFFIIFALAIATVLSLYFYGPHKRGAKPDALKDTGIQTGGNQAVCEDCNVILISVDSLRADHVGIFGYYRDTTPNFDAFAKESVLFVNHFSTSFLTPVSEASVQTGLYPASHGVTNFDTVLPESKTTITEYLKAKNYETSAIITSPEFEFYPAIKAGFSRGFDRYRYVNPDRRKDATRYRQFPTQTEITSELDGLNGKKFFLWLPLGGVHWPYGWTAKNIYADPDYRGILKGRVLDWEGAFKHVYKEVSYPVGKKLTDSDVQYVRDKYDNGIRAFDDFLGVLLGELRRGNVLEKTIVVIESEHGEDLGEHGYFAHYDVFDTQTHVPLLIFAPSFPGGQRVASFASSVDVFPTVIELLGDAVPERIEGKGLMSLITGKEQDGERREVFMERIPLWEEADLILRKSLEERGITVKSGKYGDIAIRTPEWKFILRTAREREEKVSWWSTLTGKPVKIPEAELYNLADDPLETQNVINQYPEEAGALRKKLEDWRARISPNAPSHSEIKEYIQPYF